MRVIQYTRELKIVNLDQLPHGTGARFLEVFPDPTHGTLVAVQWRRKIRRQYSTQFALVAMPDP